MTNWQPGQPLVIETERFILRSMVPDDVTADYVNWWNDAEIQKGFGNPPRKFTMEKSQKHVAQFNNKNNFHLGIYERKSDRLVGFYAITIDLRQKVSKANVCIGDKSLWNQGVATELGLAAIKYRFEYMGVEKIEGEVRGENKASMMLYEKMGFKKEGMLRKQGFGPDRHRIDIHVYGLLKHEWLERKKK